jgi:hypothetical protein
VPRYNEIINNFINGEVSPRMYGRTDSEIYKRSCRTLKNMINLAQGGAKRRIGTEFIRDNFLANDFTKQVITDAARIIPFPYNEDENYIVCLHGDGAVGNYFIYVINTNDGVITAPYFNGGASAGWPVDSIGAGAVSANTLTDADTIAEIQYAQNGALMYFAHQDLPPFYLYRAGKNQFQVGDFYRPFYLYTGTTFTAADAWRAWPFADLNTTATTITPGATTGSGVTFTASTGIFTADHEDSFLTINNSGTVGVALITGVTSSTVVTCTIYSTMPGTSAYTSWALSAWSKDRGYPKSVTFFQGRAVWGGSKKQPERIWFSQLNDLFEMSNTTVLNPGATAAASDPGSFTPASTEVNEINWLRGGVRNLLIGTRGREYSASELSGATGATVLAQTSFGSESVQPAVVEDTPVFVQRGFHKLREMVYDYRVEGYGASDITFLAEHMPYLSQDVLGDTSVARIKAMAYQALENSILWVVDTNGYLYACTKSRENAVQAFHRHELGGEYDGEFPRVLSICSVPSSDGSGDDLYLLVKRTIDGASANYLERMRKDFRGTTLHSDLETRENQPVFLDSAKILRPRTSNFWAPLTSAGTAFAAGGSTTATTTGTVNYTRGFAYAAAATSYISYDGTSNADFAQTGCIRFTYYQLPGSTEVGTRTLLNISKAAADNFNQIKLNLEQDGDLVLTIRDSTGATIINGVTFGNLYNYYKGLPTTPASTIGNYYNTAGIVIELNYDLTVGATRLFLNGVQVGSTVTSTGTRDTAIDLIRLNADEAGNGSLAESGYGQLVIFNTVQHTADHEVFEHVLSTQSLTNLDYLEGEEVGVLLDGNYLGDFTVASGAIDLGAGNTGYTTIIVGKKYTHKLEIQPVDLGSGIGSAVGAIQRIDRAVVRFNSSASASVGPDENTLEELVFRDPDDPMGDPITLVTDDKVVDFQGNYDRQARLVVMSENPLPCNVTCVSLRGVVGDV